MLLKRIWIFALLLPLFVGCSAVRLTYGQGPLLAYWWLDDHLDFTRDQAPRVRASLDEWFAWHRATQLGDYAALLAGAEQQAVDKVTPEQVCRLWVDAQARLYQSVEPSLPMLGRMVRGLSTDQLTHLEQRYAKSNTKWADEHLQANLSERREALQKRWVDRMEMVYGPLSNTQIQRAAAGMAASPYDAQKWFDERKLQQQGILRALRQIQATKADQAAAEAAIRGLVEDFLHSPRAEFRLLRERSEQAQCGLLAQLHNSATPAQRQHAGQQLAEWRADLSTLAATAATPAAAPASPVKASKSPSPAGG